jgi:hypothetical protein
LVIAGLPGVPFGGCKEVTEIGNWHDGFCMQWAVFGELLLVGIMDDSQ